jgi:hypothetical protein
VREDRGLVKWRLDCSGLRTTNPQRSALGNTRRWKRRRRRMRRRRKRKRRRRHMGDGVSMEVKVGRFAFRCKDLFVGSPLSS